MYHKPVCVKCGLEMRRVQGGVVVCDMARGPSKLWFADKFRCPACNNSVMTDFGGSAFAEHYEDGFAERLDHFREQGIVIESRSYGGNDLKVYNVKHTWTEFREGHFQVLARSKEEAEQQATSLDNWEGKVIEVEDDKSEVEEAI